MEKDKKEQEDEKSLQNDNEEELTGYPIDHGWAWMVMLGSFGMHMFTVGGLKSFGVLFQELQLKFSASSSEIASVYSLSSFLLFATGPLANALANRFSYRCVVFIGGIFIGKGFLLTSFVRSLWLLFICYGIIAGLGFGLSYSPFIVMVGHHFDKRRSLAMGLSVSGSGFGSFIFPNLMRLLLNTYNLDGVMLILAGAMTHVCMFGCLIRPIEYYRTNCKKPLNSPKKQTQENMEALLDQTANTDKSTENYILKNESKTSKPRSRMNTLMHADSITSGSLSDMIIVQVEECAKDDQSLGDKTSCLRIRKLFNCMGASEDGSRENSENACLDCSLLLDPAFLVIGFALLFASFGYMNIFIIIPSHAIDLGMTDSEGAFLLSLTGLSDIFGRLFFGWFADLKLFSRQYQFFLSLLLCSIAIGLIPFIYTYSGLAALCCFTGLFAGAYIALVPVVLVDVLGLEKLSSSIGLGMLFVSVGMLLGPPAVGWIRDASNRQWMNSLFFCAFLNLLGSSMVLFEPLAKRYNRRRKKNVEVEDKTVTNDVS